MLEGFIRRIRVWKLRLMLGEGLELAPVKPHIKKGADIKISAGGKVRLGACLLNKNVFLCAAGGVIALSDNVTVNRNAILVSRERITIGQGSSVGPNVCIYDHDHTYGKDGVSKSEFTARPIVIGSSCWIGANVTILKGTTLGDGCVVGAGTVLKGEYPPHSVIYNKREVVSKAM